MFDFVQNWVLQAGTLGAAGFFIGAFLEEVALPLPSPLLLIGVAFFVGQPLFSLSVIGKITFVVILPISAGAALGSLVIYGLTYAGGKSAIDRFGKRLGINWGDVLKLQEKLSHRKSDEAVLFFSRCLPFTPTTLITALAGIIRMNVWIFLGLTFAGIFVRVSVLFAGALLLGHSIFH